MPFANINRNWVLPSIIGLLSTPALMAQEQWKVSINKYDLREVTYDSKAIIFGTSRDTRLHFLCARGGKGATGYLTMHFIFSNSSNLPGFDLGYFDGVDAPVGVKKLMRIVLVKGGKRTTFHVGLTGTGTADVEDGYSFETGTPTNNKNGYMRKVVEEILGGAGTIEIGIVDGHDPSKKIEASFSLTGSQTAFKRMMDGIR